MQPDIAHPCCDKLTAIKTGFPVTMQYHLTVLQAQVLTHRGCQYFLEVICGQVTSFQMIPGSSSIFLKCVGNKLYL